MITTCPTCEKNVLLAPNGLVLNHLRPTPNGAEKRCEQSARYAGSAT